MPVPLVGLRLTGSHCSLSQDGTSFPGCIVGENMRPGNEAKQDDASDYIKGAICVPAPECPF